MFPLEQGAFEMLLIGAIALIVVGPKDLPILMRKVGQFTAKMRGMAAEFRSSFDEMARQSELDELRKEVEAMRNGQYTAPISAEIDQHLSDANPYPNGYPSSPEPDPVISLDETGGGDHPHAPFAGEEKTRKPRVKKIDAATDAPPKLRAPRKPKAAPAREAEG
jgi:sec-independent protein translocase protein TatB